VELFSVQRLSTQFLAAFAIFFPPVFKSRTWHFSWHHPLTTWGVEKYIWIISLNEGNRTYGSVRMVVRKRIAVIGAGPAGAIAVDCLAQENAFSVIRVFERREKAGGCWYVYFAYEHVQID
jgi:hypothetical protein